METQLCQAAGAGDLHSVRRLIENGVSVNSVDYDYRTPLHIACAEVSALLSHKYNLLQGKVDVVEHLLTLDVDINAMDRWRATPLEDALKSRTNAQLDEQKAAIARIIELLQERGAKTSYSSETNNFVSFFSFDPFKQV